MALRSDRGPVHVGLGGKAAGVVFLLMLFAFVTESQLTQYVQTTLDYRQPFFLFYIAHSSFIVIFPLHLLYLIVFTPFTAQVYMSGLSTAFKIHMSGKSIGSQYAARDMAFPTSKFIFLVSWLTAGVTFPGLLWFAAITLASVSDVTAIWNSNAFWAYVISVKLQSLPWEPRRLASVVIACLGVLAVVYGSENPQSIVSEVAERAQSFDIRTLATQPNAPLIGNLLTLFASVGYGLYQVMYKRYAALPNDPEAEPSTWERLSISYDSISDSLSPHVETLDVQPQDMIYPPPFALHPNFLTSCIGLCTLFVLWIPIPILHYFSIELFKLPPDWPTFIAVCGIAITGVTFYAGFMILLGVWGPIITSVGNLLTIVLTLASDVIIVGAAEVLTFWSLLGSGMIVCAFGVLAYDVLRS